MISAAQKATREVKCFREGEEQLHQEKLAVLQSLKQDVKRHLREVVDASPIIDTKSAVPKLFS